MSEKRAVTMDKLVSLCKNRGFIFPGSEIYGGLANSWDYGPLGVELKNNVKKAWWKKSVQYGRGLRHFNESARLESFRAFKRLFRSADGLQKLQIAPPCR